MVDEGQTGRGGEGGKEGRMRKVMLRLDVREKGSDEGGERGERGGEL